MFNKSVGLRSKVLEDEEVEVKTIQGAKITMPEYVVGQKRRRDKKKSSEPKINVTSNANALRLDHLLDDEIE